MKSKRAAGPTMAADRLFGGCAFYIAPRRVRCLCIGPAVAALLVAASLGAARAVDMPDSCDYEEPTPGTKAKPFDINVSAEFDTDYIYRGITLSSHQPAVGVTIEVDRGPFYFTFEPHSVKLPTNPSAELGFTGGWCKKVADKIISGRSITITRARFRSGR